VDKKFNPVNKITKLNTFRKQDTNAASCDVIWLEISFLGIGFVEIHLPLYGPV